jgi:hypothetical protein
MLHTDTTPARNLPIDQPIVVKCVRANTGKIIATFKRRFGFVTSDTRDHDIVIEIDAIRRWHGDAVLRELTVLRVYEDETEVLANYTTQRSVKNFFARRGFFTKLGIPEGFLGELLLVLLQDFLYWDYSHSMSRDILRKYQVANTARELADTLIPRAMA